MNLTPRHPGVPVVLSKKPFPKSWRVCPWPKLILTMGDIEVDKDDGLRCRYMVFKTRADMRKVFMHLFRRYGVYDRKWVCSKTDGICVNATVLTHEIEKGRPEKVIKVTHDPTFFAFIGLFKGSITAAELAHEAVHAAFAYAERTGKVWPGQETNQHEQICYPTGLITYHLIDAMTQHGHLTKT